MKIDTLAAWPAPAPSLRPIHLALRRSPTEALAAGSTLAGDVVVPLTRTMLDALTIEERAVLHCLDVTEGDGPDGVRVSFRRLAATHSPALTLHADEVTEESVTTALRSALQAELVYREKLAAAIRANPEGCVSCDGFLSTNASSDVRRLQSSVGPRHPALDEIQAFADARAEAVREANDARDAANRAAHEAAMEAVYRKHREAFLELGDNELVRYSEVLHGWAPVTFTAKGGDPEVVAQNTRAGRLAKEKKEADVEALRAFARGVTELLPLLDEGYDVTAGVARHVTRSVMAAIKETCEGLSGGVVTHDKPDTDTDCTSVDAADLAERKRVESAARSVALPPETTVTVSRICGPPRRPYAVITVASRLFAAPFLVVNFLGIESAQ